MTGLTRRALAGAAASLAVLPHARAQASAWQWSYPMGLPDRVPGDGLYIRHGYATENVDFYPGGWHTGENWYLLDNGSAGLPVYAVADGEIVFAGYDYPGPVVIIRHAPELYSMYGHLAYELLRDSGTVTRGEQIGTVLDRTDGRSPSHLHFEIRTFLTEPEVNGPSPRYSFTCGPNCPPGPGYWPTDAPEHPSAIGWRNPIHVMARRAFGGGDVPEGMEVMVAEGAPATLPIHATAERGDDASGDLAVKPGDRFPLLEIAAGAEDTGRTSAEAYLLRYRVAIPDADPAWLDALVTSEDAFGSDGRPSSLRFYLLPVVNAPTP